LASREAIADTVEVDMAAATAMTRLSALRVATNPLRGNDEWRCAVEQRRRSLIYGGSNPFRGASTGKTFHVQDVFFEAVASTNGHMSDEAAGKSGTCFACPSAGASRSSSLANTHGLRVRRRLVWRCELRRWLRPLREPDQYGVASGSGRYEADREEHPRPRYRDAQIA